MFLLQRVGNHGLSKNATVALLVFIAIVAQYNAWKQVAAIKAEIAFRQRLVSSISDLQAACDAVAAKRH